MRPVNCIMIGVAVIVGALIANPSISGQFWTSLTYGFITGFMLTAASMTINDYYDRKIDAINEPSRPIASGLIGPKKAIIFAFALTTIGFTTAIVNACLTNIFCFIIAVAACILFVTYTTIGKRSGLLGNFLVSMCVSIPFIYGSYVVFGAIKLNVLIWCSMAFLANTGREITKGIVDVVGDGMHGVKTLAVRYGEKKAAFAAASFYISAILLSPIPWLLKLVSFWFIPLVTITDIGLIVFSIELIKDYSRENARKIKKVVMLCFIIALVAFIVGVLM